MSYYSDAVTAFEIETTNRYAIVRGRCAYECVQCYLNGELVGYELPYEGAVEFHLPVLGALDIVYLLAVDAANAETDYYSDAFPTSSCRGNKITVTVYSEPGWLPTDILRIYRGGDGVAVGSLASTDIVDERTLGECGYKIGGWGTDWETNWGYGDYGGGWGSDWGYDWGYGSVSLTYTTEALPTGDYAVKATVVDRAGNESTADTDTVLIATYPRPSSGLTVGSYTKGTDTLALSWTASEDL